jgi:two-component system sensor histidine kinase AlgZ
VFDACHVGVVLRAVLFVETVLGVGAMFGASTRWTGWRAGAAHGRRLPATLVWLIAACSLKTQLLQRLSTAGQYAPGVVLGALAGCMPAPCWLLARWAGHHRAAPWLASAPAAPCCRPRWWRRWCCAPRAHPAATTARLTELQSRIRPHFLFNTLNSAIALVRDEPPRPSRCWKT